VIPRGREPLDVGFALVVALLVFAVTQIPYEQNRARTPEGKVFTDSLTFQSDYSIYFSYVHQAAEGRWWFENRVTPEPHEPIFVNLLWLAMGKLQAALDLSLAALFHLWRALGAAAIVLGFAFAAALHLESRSRRRLAILVFATGGGVGWIFKGLRHVGLPHAGGGWWLGWDAPADTFAAIHPWMQTFLFPFHACSAGLWMAALATYALAERRDAVAGRIVAGLLVAVLGVVRPHEMTAAVVAIGLYVLWRAREDGLFSRATIARGWILAIPVPVVAYLAYVVGAHPIFKSMHAQNVLPPLVPMDLLLSLGPVAVVAAAKGPELVRRARRDPAAGVLGATLVAVLGLFYAYPFFRYSLEFANLLVAPVLLVAFLPRESVRPLRLGVPALAGLLVLNAGTSVWLVVSKASEWRRPGSHAFLDRGVHEAGRFLEREARRSDVVLSLAASGHWILRYGANKVFMASPVSTLGYKTKREMARAFYHAATPAEVKSRFLRDWAIRWVVVAPGDRALGFDPAALAELRLAHSADGVDVYAVGEAS
jgi:hypothetical protein